MAWAYLQSSRASAPPKLAQINGKPRELTYKARSLLLASRLLPSYIQLSPIHHRDTEAGQLTVNSIRAQRPFDRHDWIVARSSGHQIRYIIDYYRAEPDEEGNPAFMLDVRPASDSVSSVQLKLRDALWGWWSGQGGK